MKGENISLINMKNKENYLCDYFIICSGKSKNQVYSIYESIERIINKKFNINPHHIEGNNNKKWILIDYISIVIHVFQKKIRSYYNIDQLYKNKKN